MPETNLIALRRLVVRYGAATILEDVDFELHAGEIHALVGENGAGKSTLVKVLAGSLPPSAGERHGSTRVAWVPQEVDLPSELTVRDWVFLGRERRRAGLLQHTAMDGAAARILDSLGLPLDPRLRLGHLTVAQRKLVQIARTLAVPPGFLLLDEPTAVLGARESESLFATVRSLRARGTGVLYVSHRLQEVLRLADRITVMRDGRCVSTDPAGSLDLDTIVRRMVGREIPTREARTAQPGLTMLSVEGLDADPVRGASFQVRAGEVVGLAGLLGAGRSELKEAVAGLRPRQRGRVDCRARPTLVPEDRAAKGLVGAFSLRENVFLPAEGTLLRVKRERTRLGELIDELQLRTPDGETPVSQLSGGNQQKVLLARALRRRPRLLLLDEPTAGVDLGAKAEIHASIRELARSGTAILLASSDLPELLGLSDRILPMRLGRVVGELDAADATEENLAARITGAAESADADGRSRR